MNKMMIPFSEYFDCCCLEFIEDSFSETYSGFAENKHSTTHNTKEGSDLIENTEVSFVAYE